MRFEKLNENKIRITLSSQDLLDKDIDFHSFMSNSTKSQDLFFDVLDTAEKEIGFVTKNYNIRIEALAIASGDFVITVTRSEPDLASTPGTSGVSSNFQTPNRKKLKIKRKNSFADTANAVYKFDNFDDFCNLCNFIFQKKLPILHIAKSIILYEYKNTYFLCFEQINPDYKQFKELFSSITEFAKYVYDSNLFINKVSEFGNIIMKNNAIRTGIKYFSQITK